MPRTVRPFSDRARPDSTGNAVPYDTPDTALLLELGDPGQAAWPVELAAPVDMDLIPHEARGFRSIPALAAPGPPVLVYPENHRRGALTFWGIGNTTWRVARTPYEVLRDDSAVIITGTFTIPIRVCWSDPVWVVQRTFALPTDSFQASTEDWAR